MKMKQRYQRTYEGGRPTNGWDKGERILDTSELKPGDVLILVCHPFTAENLIRVLERELPFPEGFDYEYADARTLERSDGYRMFMHTFELKEYTAGYSYELYRAIDRRPKDRSKMRVAKSKLPRWLSYSN